MSIMVIPFDDGVRRVVYGDLVDEFDLDYTQSLEELEIDVELALEALSKSESLLDKLRQLGNDVVVVRGNSHIDIVDDGKGSMGWLTIEDHIVSFENKEE